MASPESSSTHRGSMALAWGLAAAGKFLEGLIVFMGGIVLPLVGEEMALAAPQRGALAAASLVGILVGSLLFGALADRWGRRWLFSAEMGLLALGLLLAGMSPGATVLGGALLLIGLALGADYPIGHLILSEHGPSGQRGRLVIAAFGCQALGAVCGSLLALLASSLGPEAIPWRWLYLGPVLPVLAIGAARLSLPESQLWLASVEVSAAPARLQQLWNPELRRATLLSSVPWFLQDLGTYGIALFSPALLADLLRAPRPAEASAGMLQPLLARGALWIDLALLAGIAAAALLADRWGRIPLQVGGFLGCAGGLLLAVLALTSRERDPNSALLIAGVLLFQFMTNLGPNAQTYLLAGELFPTRLRGLGAGFAAASGKLGAVLIALLFPLLLERGGPPLPLLLLAGTSLLGALVTWLFRIETRGLALDGLGEPLA